MVTMKFFDINNPTALVVIREIGIGTTENNITSLASHLVVKIQ